MTDMIPAVDEWLLLMIDACLLLSHGFINY
jgi:hypothetical protein